MLLSKPAYRIAAHTLPDFRRHGDFFIELPEQDRLITFEMDGVLLDLLTKQNDRLYLMLSDRTFEAELSRHFEIFDSVMTIMKQSGVHSVRKVALKRKADHRKMYMNYSGKVETRGVLENFSQGLLEGFLFGDEDALFVANYKVNPWYLKLSD